MHSRATVTTALELADAGLSASAIAAKLDLPRRTVWHWLHESAPRCADPELCSRCLAQHDFASLTAAYVHLLGLYLGDGCLSEHRRSVYKLRLFLDPKYPEIIEHAASSIAEVRGRPANRRTTDTHCIEVFAYWRQWVCHFPQHGPGLKHHRSIVLSDWQRALVERWPEQLLRGLIESDGCRFQNTGRGGWSHPRYGFKNCSADIHGIFREACDLLGLRWTAARPYTTYVSRKADVARLDEFVGPKR